MPDIVLMDVRMPVMDGVEANRIIHQRFPSVKVMMLTTFDDDEYVFEAMSAGAVGYMLKDMPSEDLVSSIRAIRHGTIQISPKVMAKIVAMKKIRTDAKQNSPPGYDLSVLSLREREVLYLLSQGQENMEIAGKLFLAEQTVKNHISKIYNKIGVHDRINAMKWAREAHLSEEMPYLKEKYH
jgi:DNA-binding NarL/FixJ family response regulator